MQARGLGLRTWRSQKCFVSPKPGRAVYGVKWLRMYLAGRGVTLLYALYACGHCIPEQSSFAGVEVMSLNRDGLFMGTEHW